MPIFKSNKNGNDVRLDYTVNVDSSLDPTSKNPIQNKVVAEEINAANENISSNSQKIEANKTAIEELTNTVNNIPSTGNVDIASTDNAGIVKPDGETITIDEDGTIHSNGTGNINVDDCMSETSENPVQNKVVTAEINFNKIKYFETQKELDDAIKAGEITDGEYFALKEDSASSTPSSPTLSSLYADSLGRETIDDCDDGRIKNMIIYGKSEQGESPSPSYPQEIKSVVNPTIAIKYGKYVDLLSDCQWNWLRNNIENFKENSVIAIKNKGKEFIVDTYYENVLFIVNETNSNIQRIRITEDGNEYKDYTSLNSGQWGADFIECNATTNYTFLNANLKKKINCVETTGLPDKGITSTLPYTLNAIPVETGGNVTIKNQQYIADYVNIDERQLVKKCLVVNMGEIDYEYSNSDGKNRFLATIDGVKIPASNKIGNAICSSFRITDKDSGWNDYANNKDCFYIDNENGSLVFLTEEYTSVDSFKNAMTDQKIVLELETPEIIELDKYDIQKFRTLETYYPSTKVSVLSDELDGYVTFKYITDSTDVVLPPQNVDMLYSDKPKCVLYDNKGVITSEYGFTYDSLSEILQNDTWQGKIKNNDYIRLTTLNDETFNLIFNINTYKNYGDEGNIVDYHIDLISEHLIPSSIGWQMRLDNSNNGTSSEESPYLASTNMIEKLQQYFENNIPDELKNHIIDKRALVPTRYDYHSLEDDDERAWKSLGKMWLPYEVEVFGFVDQGTIRWQGGLRHYPCFHDGSKIVKRNGETGDRCWWWTASAKSESNNAFVVATAGGSVYNALALVDTEETLIGVPLCMRFK